MDQWTITGSPEINTCIIDYLILDNVANNALWQRIVFQQTVIVGTTGSPHGEVGPVPHTIHRN